MNTKAAKLRIENEFHGPDYAATRQRLFAIVDDIAQGLDVPESLLAFGAGNGFNDLGLLRLQRVVEALSST